MGCRGTSASTPTTLTSPSAVITQNVVRQPKACPIAVPSGTPTTLATVSPVNIRAIAAARRCGGTSPAATTEPTPKNAPWQSAATIRPSMTAP